MLRRSLALLAALLVVLRIAYFTSYRAELPFWDAPIGDAEVYDAAARAMTAGDWLDPGIAYRPFLYPLWLGAAYTAFGPSPFAVYCLQAVLGLATVCLVYGIGRKLFGPSAGLGAALLVGLYAPLLAGETKLLDGTLSTFLHVASVAALLAAQRARGQLFAGVLLGLAAVSRPPLLLFGAAGAAVAFRRGVRPGLVTSAGLVLGLLPFCIWNLAANGRFSPLPRNGGLALLVGYNARAGGDYNVPPGLSGEAKMQEAEEAALPTPPAELAWRWIGEHPGKALGLAVTKLYRFALADEAPLEHDFAAEREAVPILWALPIPFSLLFAFGALGLVVRRREPGVGLLALALLVHVATAVVFYVASRYRVLAAPVLAVLAAGGLAWIADAWRASRRRAAAVGAASAAAVAIALSVSPFDEDVARASTAAYNVAYGFERMGEDARATEGYLRALAIEPRFPEAWIQLGNALARAGHAGRARVAYERALALRPDHPRALANLALTFLKSGEAARARALLEGRPPADASVAFQLGNARKATGDLEGAVRAYAEATRLAPRDAAAWNNLGTTLLALARRSEDEPLRARAIESLRKAEALGSGEATRNLAGLKE